MQQSRCPFIGPDLVVDQITFSRSPIVDGQVVEIVAIIRNLGAINGRNVDVRIYDGEELIEDHRLELVPIDGTTDVVVRVDYTIQLNNPDAYSESHYIKGVI